MFAHTSVGTDHRSFETNRRSSVKKAGEKRDGITECVRGGGIVVHVEGRWRVLR